MDIAIISGVLFFASIAIFAYLVYKLSQKKTLGESSRKLRENVWYWVTCGFLALMLLLIGSVSRNVVTIVFGTFLLFAITSYVRSDHIVKRALEVIFMLLAFGLVVYGYIVTGSFILGVMTIFIVTMVFVAFVVSYLLPRIRSKFKNYS
jgi:hypothetical protein